VIVLDGGAPASSLRHLYLLPALWAALGSGAARGCLVGGMAGLLQAPLVLVAIETMGLHSEALDGLVSIAAPLALGGVVGRLRDQYAGQTGRMTALLAMQRSVGADGALETRLRPVITEIRAALRASAVALVVRSGERAPVVVSEPPANLAERSAAAWTLATGQRMEARDLGTDPRFVGHGPARPIPVRGLVLPVAANGGPAGALAIEWTGDLPPGARLAAEEAAMHLALSVENARLTVRQISFARELEDKVAAATARLRDLDRAKSEFLSVVSHELRTPLTALQGFSELLLARAIPPDRAARFLGHMHHEAQRLGRIVSELLDLSRIESGRPELLRREPVDVGELVARSVELFAAAHRGHRFEWAPGEGPLAISADRDALDRILTNLLGNAVKYSPRGGTVRISGGLAAGRSDLLELSVADEGVGIAPEALARIFDKYVRVPTAETASARGLGLGLSLVRALAEAHGGRVEVESQVGRGSTFRLLLPR
jgi:signal transduction histidine kinase